MVSMLVLTYVPLLLLAACTMVLCLKLQLTDCFLSLFLCLFVISCLLLNLGNKPRTELNMLDKVLGLLVDVTRNLCLLGSAIYNCFILPPVKL